MSARANTRTHLPSLLAAGAGLLALAATATAQPVAGTGGADGRWLPYMGCWESTGSGPEGAEGADGMLCIRPAIDQEGVEFLSVSDGSVVETQLRPADGRRQQVAREGCRGWERASFSADGRRIYLRSEFTCEGGVQRTTSGIMTMVSPYEWMDVQSVSVDGRAQPWVQRYRLAPPSRVSDAGLGDIASGLGMAVESARMAAAEHPEISDVIEASGAVDVGAVEAWIAELRDPFRVDAEALLRMSDAGVDERVIDVVVAVSYPERFDVEGDGYEADRADRRVATRRPRGVRGRGWYGSSWGYHPYDPYYYGRYSAYGHYYRPWGVYGAGFGFYRGYRPSVIVIEPRSSSPRGRVVNGRGYTRSRGSSDAGTRSIVPSRGSSSGGSISPAGASRGGSSSTTTGRKAKKKGGKGGDGGDGGGSPLL